MECLYSWAIIGLLLCFFMKVEEEEEKEKEEEKLLKQLRAAPGIRVPCLVTF